MPVTEVGCMAVKPDVDPIDEHSPSGQILARAWKAATSEPTGPYRLYWGLEVENPCNLWAFFDFASVEDHHRHGTHIVKDFDKIFDRGLFTKHVDPAPFPPSALKAPVTEVMLAFFPSDISAEAKAAATDRLAQFTERGLNNCPDVQAVNYGWGVEADFPVRGGQDGQTGCLLIALIGWPTIDAHMKFRDTDTFKESVGLLRGLQGLLKLTMFHVQCKSMENEVRKP